MTEQTHASNMIFISLKQTFVLDWIMIYLHEKGFEQAMDILANGDNADKTMLILSNFDTYRINKLFL